MITYLRYAARSDVGLKREGNEDSGFASNHLLMVADGMGGHASGELASAMAVATFAEIAEDEVPDEEVLEQLSGGVDLLSERLGDVIASDPSNQGMGTTVTGMYWTGGRVGIVHVGDSRAYRLRDGKLDQLTRDHTYVQTLVDSGQITAEAAATHPRRNLLIRAVDGIHPVEADLSMRETRVGDRYLLCSDGLTGVVPDSELAEVLRKHADPTGSVTRLVDLALEGGAPDNVTVVVADVRDADDETSSGLPVVVGAASEPANRSRLPLVPWPVDEQLDPNDPQPRTRQSDMSVTEQNDPEPFSTTVPDSDGSDSGSGTSRMLKATIGVVTGVVVVLAIVGASLLWWLRGQWYVADLDGSVAIYRGVPGSLGPIPLQKMKARSDVPVPGLPAFTRSRVEAGITAASFADAEEIVDGLDDIVTECVEQPTIPGCPKPAEGDNPPETAAKSNQEGTS